MVRLSTFLTKGLIFQLYVFSKYFGLEASNSIFSNSYYYFYSHFRGDQIYELNKKLC